MSLPEAEACAEPMGEVCSDSSSLPNADMNNDQGHAICDGTMKMEFVDNPIKVKPEFPKDEDTKITTITNEATNPAIMAILKNDVTTKRTKKCYLCIKCPTRFYSYDGLIIHSRKHVADGKVSCTSYSETFSSYSELADHRKHNHNLGSVEDSSQKLPKRQSRGQNLVCISCDRTFVDLVNLQRHIRATHDGIRTTGFPANAQADKFNMEGAIKCGLANCNKVFYTPKSFSKHLTDHIETTHTCGKCGYKTTSMSELSKHRFTHLEKGKLKKSGLKGDEERRDKSDKMSATSSADLSDSHEISDTK